MSTHVWRVLSKDFVKKSGIECCLWSAQGTETHARTSDVVKNWVFISLNVQWWKFVDNVVYCKFLRAIKTAFLEPEKAKFTGATLVPMYSVITPGPYTHSKQPKTFHAKCNLKVNCKENGFDNQKWLYECYRSQSCSQTFMPCSWRLFWIAEGFSWLLSL